MEFNTKSIIIVCVIIVGLFVGGLSYIYSENSSRRVVLDDVQKYINTEDAEARAVLAAEIKSRLQKRSWALTSKASFDSFDGLVANAQQCDSYASEKTFNPRETETDYNAVWRDCMVHPEVLQQK